MRIVDLTMTWPDVPTYPGHPEPTIHRIASFETHGKQVSKLEIGTHSGTHIDAPRHYIEGGRTVESIPLEQMCGPALLVNLTGKPRPIYAGDIERVANGRSVERVLLRYDGDRRLGSMDYYFGQPWLTYDAASWLLGNGCKLVGMDTPMPDGPEDIKTMPIHKVLLECGVVIAEYLINLDKIGAETFDLIVAPLKIKEGDGAPARCFAIVED